MKQTLIQQSNPERPVGDRLYTLFLAESETRGRSYLHMLSHSVQDGMMASAALFDVLITRLAMQPSVITILLHANINDSLDKIVHGDDNDIERGYVVELLDELPLNVRMRDLEHYEAAIQVFVDYLIECVSLNLGDEDPENAAPDNRLEEISKYINANRHKLLTIHYLRKMGIHHAVKSKPQ